MEEGGKMEEGRGKREEGRGKREEGSEQPRRRRDGSPLAAPKCRLKRLTFSLDGDNALPY
jgi:hypothetical protein